jgi:uncharacterized protein (DUF1501 family)
MPAVLGEMGRSPYLNYKGGRDHWPTMSALLFGGGVAGGSVVGATDDDLRGVSVDLATGRPSERGVILRVGHLAAGLVVHAGLDPARFLPGQEPLTAVSFASPLVGA